MPEKGTVLRFVSVTVLLLIDLAGLCCVLLILRAARQCRTELLMKRSSSKSRRSVRSSKEVSRCLFPCVELMKGRISPTEWTSGLTIVAIIGIIMVLVSGLVVCLLNLYYVSIGLKWPKIEERKVRSYVLIILFIWIGISWQTMTLVQFERLRVTFENTRYAVSEWSIRSVYVILSLNMILGAILSSINPESWWAMAIVSLVAFDYICVNLILIYAFYTRTMSVAKQLLVRISISSKTDISSRHRTESAVSTKEPSSVVIKSLDTAINSTVHDPNHDRSMIRPAVPVETDIPEELCVVSLPTVSPKSNPEQPQMVFSSSFSKTSPDSSPSKISRSSCHNRPKLQHESSNNGGIKNEDLIDASIRVSLCVILSILTTMATVLLESFDPFVKEYYNIWIIFRTLIFTCDASFNAYCLLCTYSAARHHYTRLFESIHIKIRYLLTKIDH